MSKTMNTLKQLQEKGEEELNKLIPKENDWIFDICENPLCSSQAILNILHQQTTLAFEAGKTEAVAQEQLRAFEILHKYAMKTKDVQFLDLIEKAQKDLLAKE